MLELVRWQVHLALRPWAISYEMRRRPRAAATAYAAPIACSASRDVARLQSAEHIDCTPWLTGAEFTCSFYIHALIRPAAHENQSLI
jgi:hypothetical protein